MIAVHIVAIRCLGDIDVTDFRIIAVLHDLQHFFQRAGNQGAAGLPAIEKGLLIDFLGPIRVADEYDLNMTVAAGEEQVQQCVEALGEILHIDRKSTRLNSSHYCAYRMPSSA